MVSLYSKAVQILQLTIGDRTIITHFINPEGESMVNFDCGALVQMGPTWGRHSEEWSLHFGFPVTDPKRFDKEALPPRIRQLLKLPDLEMEVLNISHWVLSRVLADKYRVGKVFVAGDAAHRRPPTVSSLPDHYLQNEC
jgi:2,4-dichlorophenol 6-monooxygenase